MEFALSEDQRQFQASLTACLTDCAPLDTIRKIAAGDHRQMGSGRVHGLVPGRGPRPRLLAESIRHHLVPNPRRKAAETGLDGPHHSALLAALVDGHVDQRGVLVLAACGGCR